MFDQRPVLLPLPTQTNDSNPATTFDHYRPIRLSLFSYVYDCIRLVLYTVDVATIYTYNHNPGGTKGLLFIGDKILVYRRDTHTTLFPLCIDLPGGGPEAHETPFQTFQREVAEEFNLRVQAKDIIFHIANDPSDDGSISHFVVAKLPEAETQNIVLGDEGTEYMLASLQDYTDLPIAEIAFPLQQQNTALYARLHLSTHS